MSKLVDGLNEISNADYHADLKYLSSSNLKLLLKDRKKFYKEKILGKREPQKENPAFDEGSFTHSLILEPELIKEEYAFFPEFRKQGPSWAAFTEQPENRGKIMLSKPQVIRCEGYFKAYTKNPIAPDLIEGGVAEATLCGELNGVPIKVRADYINVDKGYIADVKTTGYSADIETFGVTMKQYNYGLSAALYAQMFEQYYDKPFDFYFIVIAKKDRVCEVYKASDSTLMQGKLEIAKALKIYKECKETGNWENPDTGLEQFVHDSDYEILEI